MKGQVAGSAVSWYAFLIMSSRWVKIPVIILLAFAAVDLLVPGLCIVEASNQALLSSSAGSPFDSDERGIAIDDCFCCCAHIVPEHL